MVRAGKFVWPSLLVSFFLWFSARGAGNPFRENKDEYVLFFKQQGLLSFVVTLFIVSVLLQLVSRLWLYAMNNSAKA